MSDRATANLSQYEKLFRLDDQVALVAGGYGGIGSAISEGMAELGATVAITGHSPDRAEETAAALRDRGHKAFALGFEIESTEDTQRMVDAVVEEAGTVDILVNTVGMHIETPAEEYQVEDWDLVNSVNLRGAFFLSQAVAKQQIAQEKGGKHIHISSVRSVLGIRRGYVSYCTTKGGLNLMVKQLATEWAKYNITVNAVAPTFIRTDLVKKYLEDPVFYNNLVERIPLARVGEPEDVATATIFLASPAANFITGHVLMLDGGVTATQ